jgi:hypothetical protein
VTSTARMEPRTPYRSQNRFQGAPIITRRQPSNAASSVTASGCPAWWRIVSVTNTSAPPCACHAAAAAWMTSARSDRMTAEQTGHAHTDPHRSVPE